MLCSNIMQIRWQLYKACIVPQIGRRCVYKSMTVPIIIWKLSSVAHAQIELWNDLCILKLAAHAVLFARSCQYLDKDGISGET